MNYPTPHVCILCERPAKVTEGSNEAFRIECARCQLFTISAEALDPVRFLTPDDKIRLMCVTRETFERTQTVTQILTSSIQNMLATAPERYDISTRARRLLTAVARRSTYAGLSVSLFFERDYPLAHCGHDASEFIFLTRYVESQKWAAVSVLGDRASFIISPLGWEEIQRRPRTESEKAFVAMWFNDDVAAAYENGIYEAIRTDCGFRPVKIDVEEYNGDIVDQVLAEINESRFVVADLTGHRNGVYFEAGYAMGKGIPVIWTCRDDDGKGTHFDAEHFNQIRWPTPELLRHKLQGRIRATIGLGPLAPEKS